MPDTLRCNYHNQLAPPSVLLATSGKAASGFSATTYGRASGWSSLCFKWAKMYQLETQVRMVHTKYRLAHVSVQEPAGRGKGSVRQQAEDLPEGLRVPADR